MNTLPQELPACLNSEQVAQLLGVARHAVPVLVRHRLLQHMGAPRANAVKLFARERVLGLCQDERWLTRAVETIRAHWRTKNLRRKCKQTLKPNTKSSSNPTTQEHS